MAGQSLLFLFVDIRADVEEPGGKDEACQLMIVRIILVSAAIYSLDLKALLAGGHDSQPITELRSLQESLRQVLQIPLGEGNCACDPNLAFTWSSVNVGAGRKYTVRHRLLLLRDLLKSAA